MINIFGIFFLNFLAFKKTIITLKFAKIPTDAIIVDKIMTICSICEEDLLIESFIWISVTSWTILKRLLDVILKSVMVKASNPRTGFYAAVGN